MHENVPIYRKKDGIYRFYLDTTKHKYIEYQENGTPMPPHILTTMLTKLSDISKYPKIKSYKLIDEFEESNAVVDPIPDEEIKKYNPKAYAELKAQGEIKESVEQKTEQQPNVMGNIISQLLPMAPTLLSQMKQSDNGNNQAVCTRFMQLIKDYTRTKNKKEKAIHKIRIETFEEAIDMINPNLLNEVRTLKEILED